MKNNTDSLIFQSGCLRWSTNICYPDENLTFSSGAPQINLQANSFALLWREIMEKLYKKLGIAGGAGIAVGIVVLVIGVATGVIAIITGASILKNRDDITF